MKNLKNGALCVFLSICFITGTAQISHSSKEFETRKPKLFADLPEKMPLKISILTSILDVAEGKTVNVQLGGKFNYHGVVVSKSNPEEASSKSIVIKSLNRQGATLTFTRSLNSKGDLVYLGRILSFKHSDAFELQLENGQYSFIKKPLDDLFNE